MVVSEQAVGYSPQKGADKAWLGWETAVSHSPGGVTGDVLDDILLSQLGKKDTLTAP